MRNQITQDGVTYSLQFAQTAHRRWEWWWRWWWYQISDGQLKMSGLTPVISGPQTNSSPVCAVIGVSGSVNFKIMSLMISTYLKDSERNLVFFMSDFFLMKKDRGQTNLCLCFFFSPHFVTVTFINQFCYLNIHSCLTCHFMGIVTSGMNSSCRGTL